MDEQRSCGQGLADHSVLPSKLAELIASLAENLEIHTKALDASDEDARKELDAYLKLTREHRQLATRLRATAEQMAGYRDLPMGRHDEAAMSDPKVVDAFGTFIKVERELLALLRTRVEQDEKILAEMPGGGSRSNERTRM